MATRSYIAIENENGTIYYIYCHNDGYLAHNGVLLNKYYNTKDKVNELINLGDISVLKEKINPTTDTHSFDNPEKDVVIAYVRDRGDEVVTPTKRTNFATLLRLKEDSGIEFIYIFRNNKWYVIDLKKGTKLLLLKKELDALK